VHPAFSGIFFIISDLWLWYTSWRKPVHLLANFCILSLAKICTLYYTAYTWSAQGDLGEWALTYKDTCNVEHIILYCEWGFHYDDVYCGNMIFDNENIIRS
jgi:hypothetical protein